MVVLLVVLGRCTRLQEAVRGRESISGLVLWAEFAEYGIIPCGKPSEHDTRRFQAAHAAPTLGSISGNLPDWLHAFVSKLRQACVMQLHGAEMNWPRERKQDEEKSKLEADPQMASSDRH